MKKFSKLLLSFTFLVNSLICDYINVRFDWVAVKWDAQSQTAQAFDSIVELDAPFTTRTFRYDVNYGNHTISYYFNSAYRSYSGDSVHMLPLNIVSKFVPLFDVPRKDFLDTEGRHKKSGFLGLNPSSFSSSNEYKAVMSAYVDKLLSKEPIGLIYFDDLAWLFKFFQRNRNDFSADIQQVLIDETRTKVTEKVISLESYFAGKTELLELYTAALFVLKALSDASCVFEPKQKLNDLALKSMSFVVNHLNDEYLSLVDCECLDINDIRNAYVKFYCQYCDINSWFKNIKNWCSVDVATEAKKTELLFHKSLKVLWSHLSVKDKFKSLHRCHPVKMTFFWITFICLGGYGCYVAHERGFDKKAGRFMLKNLRSLITEFKDWQSKPAAPAPSALDDLD